MGLFSRGDKIRGWAQVVSTTAPPHQATSGTCRMQVIVQADGIPATHVEATRICKVKKWPQPGMALPVELDPKKPEKFDIVWDEVESWQDQARRQAAMMAQQMNQAGAPGSGGQGTGVPGMFGGGPVQVVNLSGAPADPVSLAQVEQMVGMDLDGDGRIGGAPGAGSAVMGAPPPPRPSGGPDDRIAALERLAALRDNGVLTPTEFEAEKRRLLGS